MDYPDPWPLRHLVLRTPRLELRPDDDAGLLELAGQAYQGVHEPDEMPFSFPWTDAPDPDLGRNLVQYHWKSRAHCSPEGWHLHFLVRLHGRVIGSQGLSSTDFLVTREVHTGSWVGQHYQGNGYGTEMRAAVLMFAFDHLGAVHARSDAYRDNPPSRGVSRALGYVEDGTQITARRGEPAEQVRLLVTSERFVRPSWAPEVLGMTECRDFFGLPE